MCLKYYIGHSACNHYEYLGSHHCSTARPCELDTQHFHYIDDSFPIPWPSSLQFGSQTERSSLACSTCAAKHCGKVDPDEVPVQFYSPTNNVRIKETQPTDYLSPFRVVQVEPNEIQIDGEESEGSGDSYNYDYKSLSDAEEDELDRKDQQDGSAETDNEGHDEMHSDFPHVQPQYTPHHRAHQLHLCPFPSPGFAPAAYAFGNYPYPYYPSSHITHLAPPSVFFMPHWHGGMSSLSSPVLSFASPSCRDDQPPSHMSLLAQDVGPTVAQQHPVTPPPTPPTGPKTLLPPHHTPPFIVGTMTDAYVRMEVARRKRVMRAMRDRARRRARIPSQDTLPTRSMALTDFMVNKRQKKEHYEGEEMSGAVVENTWSSLPFAEEGSDTKQRV